MFHFDDDCLHCIQKFSRPIRLTKLTKKLKELPSSNYDEKIQWTADIRKTLEVYKELTPFIEDLLQCGYMTCLLQLAQQFDAPFYPTYAFDILSKLVNLKVDLVKELLKNGVYKVTKLALKKGVYTQKYMASSLCMSILLYEKND